MKLLRFLRVAVVAVLIAAQANLVQAEAPTNWALTTNYPMQVAGESCVSATARVYCVGGFDSNSNSHNNVYDAGLSSSGIGTWASDPAYPTPIDSASCVDAVVGSANTIYCVGGEDGSKVLNGVYSTSVGSSGLGAWSSGPAYPSDASAISCVADAGYIYCVGGFDSNGNEVSSAYYASYTSGLGAWTATTQYPLPVDSESCIAYVNSIYCVAGETENGQNQNSPITRVYSAPLSLSGIGPWTSTNSYPTALAALDCASYQAYIYCVGGFDANLLSSEDSYYAQAYASGVGMWATGFPYPLAIDSASCVTSSSYLYCIAGSHVLESGQSIVSTSYFAAISPPPTQTPEFPVSLAVPATLALGMMLALVLGRAWRARPF